MAAPLVLVGVGFDRSPTTATLGSIPSGGAGGTSYTVSTALLTTGIGFQNAIVIAALSSIPSLGAGGTSYTGTTSLITAGVGFTNTITLNANAPVAGTGGTSYTGSTALFLTGVGFTNAIVLIGSPSAPLTIVATVTGIKSRLLTATLTGASIASVAWDFGDGIVGAAGNPTTHTYPRYGSYTVTALAYIEAINAYVDGVITLTLVAVGQGLETTAFTPDASTFAETLASLLNREIGYHGYEPVYTRGGPSQVSAIGTNGNGATGNLFIAAGTEATVASYTTVAPTRITSCLVSGDTDARFRVLVAGAEVVPARYVHYTEQQTDILAGKATIFVAKGVVVTIVALAQGRIGGNYQATILGEYDL